jgi:hypothetical protein
MRPDSREAHEVLTARLRGILGQPAKAGFSLRPPEPVATPSDRCAGLERHLGGEWRVENGARCFVVERAVDASFNCGPGRIGDLAAALERISSRMPMLAGTSAIGTPLVFFDLETTGLSGGAGTLAFLIGLGAFDAAGVFVTRQLVMTSYADERPMLQVAVRHLGSAGGVVTFNGKSFDAAVLETRCLFHRLDWTSRSLPHLDVLHSARRFWRGSQGADNSSCSLGALERAILGTPRVADVDGFEIPARYFNFVRTGDPRPLAPVLEHNRLDLLSLAALTVRLLWLVEAGPDETSRAQEALALGQVYLRGGDGRAARAFERALSLSEGSGGLTGVTLEACRALAAIARRQRRHDEAAARWRQLLEAPDCPPNVAREALEALAIHHEHRLRDLPAAKAFALQMGQGGRVGQMGRVGERSEQSVRHRLARLDRKITTAAARPAADTARLELTD